MPKFICFKQFLFVVSVLLFVSCDKDFNEIGANIIEQNNVAFSEESYSVIAYNEKVEAVQSDNLTVNPLGVYNNPAFGQTIASFVTEVELASVNPNLDSRLNQEMVSAILNIPYFIDPEKTKTKDKGGFTYELDSIYGNKESAKFKLSIYESGYHMTYETKDSLTTTEKFYTNQNSYFDGKKIGNRLNDSIPAQNDQFFFDNSQIVTATKTNTTYSAPAMKLSLNKEFFKNKILNAPAGKLANNINFKEYFNGLYFKVEKAEGSEGQMAMLDFSKATITIKFKEDTNLTNTNRIQRSIVLNLTGKKVSLLEDSNQNSAYSNTLATKNTTVGDNKLYLKGGQGSLTVIELFKEPGQLQALRDEKPLINEANLEFFIDTQDETFKKSSEPQRIYLYDLENNRPILDYSISNSKKGSIVYDGRLVLDGTPTPRGKSYKIRITNHIRNLIKNTSSANVKLGVVVTEDINIFSSKKIFNPTGIINEVPTASVMNPLGTILYGTGNDVPEAKKLKLKIYYTKPN